MFVMIDFGHLLPFCAQHVHRIVQNVQMLRHVLRVILGIFQIKVNAELVVV